MTDLVKDEIKKLIVDGWKCDDFPGLCKILSHQGKINYLVYDPSNIVAQEEFVKDENFEGNTIVLHIGEITGLPAEAVSNKEIIIPSGKFMFFLTRECVNVPFDLNGTLFMNPRIANQGLLFYTLGKVDPGFHGCLTATLLNTTNNSILLHRHEGVLYLSIGKLSKSTIPHELYHSNPQFSITEAQRNLSYNLNPGFILTKEVFATKEDLKGVRDEFITFRTIMIGIIALLVSVFLPIFWGILNRLLDP